MLRIAEKKGNGITTTVLLVFDRFVGKRKGA